MKGGGSHNGVIANEGGVHFVNEGGSFDTVGGPSVNEGVFVNGRGGPFASGGVTL